MEKLLQKVMTVSEKKGLKISCKKAERMVVSTRNSQIWKVQIGDTKIKQAQQFKYLGSILAEDGKYATEIRSHNETAKYTF